MIKTWPRPRVLEEGYLARIVVLRLCLVCLASSTLDATLAARSYGSSWGWASRAGMLGMLVPLLMNVAGLLWPFLQLETYEAHYQAFNKAVMYAGVLGKLLEQLSGSGNTASSCQQSMLLQGVLFIVHQDPIQEFLPPLAVMLAAYTACHLCGGAGSLVKGVLASSRRVAAAGGSLTAAAASTAAAGAATGAVARHPLAVTTAGEFFLSTFMVVLVLHRLYCTYMGPREHAAAVAAGDLNRAQVHAAAKGGSMASWATNSNRSAHKQRRASMVGGPQLGLSRAYLLKLAVVHFTNACFVLMYVLQYQQQASRSLAAGTYSSGLTSGGLWLRFPVVVAMVWVGMLLCHGLVGFCAPRWYQRHLAVVNALSFYTCAAAQLFLVWVHGWQHARRGRDDGVSVPALSSDQVFHSFLMLVFSLTVNEDALPVFAAQLCGVAVVFRWVHLQLLGAAPGAPGLLTSWLELPEYVVVTSCVVLVYRWLCVGRFQQPQVMAASGAWLAAQGAHSVTTDRAGKRIRRSSKQSGPSPIWSEQQADSLAVLGRDQQGTLDSSARLQRRRLATPRRSRTLSNADDPLRQHLAASPATGLSPALCNLGTTTATPGTAEARTVLGGRPVLRAAAITESPKTSGAARASLHNLPGRRVPSVDIRHVSKANFELPLPTSPSASSSEDLSSTRLQALVPPHQQHVWRTSDEHQQQQVEQAQACDEQAPQQQHAREGQSQADQRPCRTPPPPQAPGIHLLSSLYGGTPGALQEGAAQPIHPGTTGSASPSPGTFSSPLGSGAPSASLGTLPVLAFVLSSIAEGPGTPTEPQPPLACPQDTGSSEEAGSSGFGSSSSSGSDSGLAPKEGHQEAALGAAAGTTTAPTAGPSSEPSWWSWGAKARPATTTVQGHALSSSGLGSVDSLSASETSAGDASSSRGSGSYNAISRNGLLTNASMSLAGTLEQLEQQQLQQDPVTLQRQRVACDAMMCLLELPVQLAHAPRLLVTVLRGSSAAGLAWPCRLLGAAGVVLYLLGGVLHLAYLLLRPADALQRRRILWPVRVCLAPAVLRVVHAVLQVQASWPARRGIMVLCSCMGLLDLPVRVLAAWLPLMSVVYYAVHAWTLWQVRSWALLAFDAVEFNLFPLICYASTRGAVMLMQRGLDAALPRLQGWLRARACAVDGQPCHHNHHQHSVRQRRTSRRSAEHQHHHHHDQQQKQPEQPEQSAPPQQQEQPWRSRLEGVLVVIAAAGSQLVVSVVLMWVLLKGPLHLPSGHDPWTALESTKAVLGSMLERMGLHILTQTKQEMAQLLLALTGIAVSFLVVSGLQALVLSAAAWRDPRRSAYQAAKAQVFTLGERTMTSLALLDEGAGAAEIDTVLLSTIQEVTAGCFPNCSLVLVLLEEASLGSCAAQRHVIHAAPEFAGLPKVSSLPLGALPSVETACKERHVIFKSDVAKGAAGYSDWQELVDQCGQTTFLVVPLSFAHRTLGALVVTSKSPVSLNKYLRKLAVELSFALAQILYTRLCIEQLRAGNEIINDVLPQPVAEHLRRRVISARSASMTLSVSGLDQMTQQQRLPHYWQQPATPLGEGLPGPRRSGGLVPDSPHQGLLSRLSEAASALRSQQQQLQQAGGSEQQQVHPRLPASEQGAFGVAYKSWHPHVTVLFADIAGYTAMSTDVEPEAVMLLLHELFSKYDHLCTQYGIYKVETIGDCYMACSGVLVDNPQHAQHIVQFGCAMLAVAASVQSPLGGSVRIRVGIHSGRVMSGIVGNIRARYCLFGDTVNTASRMESTGIVDRVQITEDTYGLLGPLQADFEPREAVVVKGKGIMQTYVLRGEAAERLRAEGVTVTGSAYGGLCAR